MPLTVIHSGSGFDPALIRDHADTQLNADRLLIAHQLPGEPTRLFDANIFYPERRVLAFSSRCFLVSARWFPGLWGHRPC
jgi:hypothetical protein